MTESPRWSLIEPHYINVRELPDGTKIEWEHKETSRESGRAVRKLFVVPMLLDPRDAADHNYPGEIIVAREIEGQSNLRMDYIFEGDPTQGMEPLNEAAQVITDSLRAKWVDPIQSAGISGDMNDREKAFMENMMRAFAGAAQASAVPNATVPREDYDELKERLAKLEAMIAAQNNPKPGEAGRRV